MTIIIIKDSISRERRPSCLPVPSTYLALPRWGCLWGGLADDHLHHIVSGDLQFLQFHFVCQRAPRKEPALAAECNALLHLQAALHVLHRVGAADQQPQVFACGETQAQAAPLACAGGRLLHVPHLQLALLLHHVDGRYQAVHRQLVAVAQLIVALAQSTWEGRAGGQRLEPSTASLGKKMRVQEITDLATSLC